LQSQFSQAPDGGDGGPLSKLYSDQTLGNFNRSEGGRAMSWSWSQEANSSHRFSLAPSGGDGGPLTKLFQTREKFNRPEGGRAIKGRWLKGDDPSYGSGLGPGGPDARFNIVSPKGKY
jgi:hypothetical protein